MILGTLIPTGCATTTGAKAAAIGCELAAIACAVCARKASQLEIESTPDDFHSSTTAPTSGGEAAPQ